jgi:hypothetical protein
LISRIVFVLAPEACRAGQVNRCSPRTLQNPFDWHFVKIQIPELISEFVQKILIIIGVILIAIGLTWPWLGSLHLGRLPGDIVIERDNFSFYLPITTMIIISVLISLAVWFFRQ